MARYNAEEACGLLMNDENFGDMDSADSLDDGFSDSTTLCLKVVQILKMTLLEKLFL